jgi:hypothetical protein
MAVRIDTNELRQTINDILDEYGDEAREAIEAASKKTGKAVASELKKAGDFGGSGDFKKGWTSKTELTRTGASTVVYNKDLPGLAHLLEFGHAKANGGRTKAFNFIAPITDTVEEKFADAFEREMK